jgi:hypothetical protein
MFYSQRDVKWATKKLGFGKTTIGSSGCFITSIGNIVEKTPIEINDLAKKCGAFNVDMLNAGILAKYLGYGYVKQIRPPVSVCVAETNYYKKVGVPQHFFLLNPKNSKRVDPLDIEPAWESNNYPIVSYRLFVKLEAKKSPVASQKPADVKLPTPPVETPVIAKQEPITTPKPIKLSELPPIKEYTWLDELKELILDLINLITKKK